MNRKLITLLILGLALFAAFSITPAFAHPAEENGTANAIARMGGNPMMPMHDTPAADAAWDATDTRAPTCLANHPH